MAKRHLLLIEAIILTFLIYVTASANSFEDRYGVAEGDIVESGFVFIDGLYIESPYKISRRGLSIYVNDRRILNPTRHTGKQPAIIKDDPELMTEEEQLRIVRKLDATRKIYEDNLQDECCYLFCSEGGHLKLDAYTTAYDLARYINVITSENFSLEDKKSMLESANWHLFINTESFIINFKSSPQLSQKLPDLAQDLLRIEEFGISDIETQEGGFLFVGGKYIEGPYAVQRKGLGVFINGNMIERPMNWPVYIPSGNADPPLPEGINEDTSFNDDIFNRYFIEKQAFLYKHHRNDAAKMMEEVIRNLPFVTNAVKDTESPHILHITTNEGSQTALSLVPMRGRELSWEKEDVLRRVEQRREYYQKVMTNGGCIFLSSDGAMRRLSKGSTQSILPELAKILASDNSTKEKKEKIKALKIQFTEHCLSELINNFTLNSELAGRLENK